jgi:ribosomal protein S18 acetylase RimI-like enzyme
VPTLTSTDLTEDELTALVRRCLDADGGLPFAADPGFLRGRWMTPTTVAVRDDAGRLIAAGAVRAGGIFCGLVDPAERGAGTGGSVLDWGLERAETVETEGLSPAAEGLFASRGLRQVFAEDVMRIDLTTDPTVAPARPEGATLAVWSEASAPRFHAVYDAAFRERPGFPGWTAAEWIDGVVEDGFRPDWSVLVSVPTLGDVGFITAAEGWIDQVGVVPEARGRGIGAALIGEALGRMRADGATEAWLNVNVDNPASALYRRLGFVDKGRRARYQR